MSPCTICKTDFKSFEHERDLEYCVECANEIIAKLEKSSVTELDNAIETVKKEFVENHG